MDISKIRDNIILKEGIYYFDYTASGLAYKPIEEEILRILQTYSNTHSESSQTARITSEYYENARNGIKSLLKLKDDFYLMPCGYGSSGAIKKFQELVGIYIPPASKKVLNLDIKTLPNLPLVIVSPYEHHSNEVSFREGLCEVIRVPLGEDGKIDFSKFSEILNANRGRKIIISFSAASNVTGILSDYKRVYLTAKAYSAIVAFDASSISAYANLDSDFFDALFISGHKLLGGVGSCGLLAIKKNLCKDDEPTFAGGGTVTYVGKNKQLYTVDKEQLEQGGTPGILQLIRAYLAFKLRNDIGLDVIKNKEKYLGEYFLSKISKIEDVVLYAKDIGMDERLPIFSFNVDGFNPYDFAAILSQNYEVETRAGCACAGPYGHDLLGLGDEYEIDETNKPGWVRVSLHYTHTKEDIDYLISAIKAIIKKRGKIKFTKGRYIC
ncbi:aminotransferase class V-fold PLP-dependent enzyme [Campylobacter geochelonis]|uniref:aminotransferase class V-fold PLP-dependent enzyme n=1 Tax=Campylobacter geochelonis TaxID=1780362 RepID=UPI000770B38B|nr:aminotransferase class V-fold PLP-dependent enzyme [Campylobacter geochelonis]CZE48455.1 putative aminotransferase [Campylobacter geochelonis]CZE51200.1 putative aminotransferase [Campylobacter geochelonis]